MLVTYSVKNAGRGRRTAHRASACGNGGWNERVSGEGLGWGKKKMLGTKVHRNAGRARDTLFLQRGQKLPKPT